MSSLRRGDCSQRSVETPPLFAAFGEAATEGSISARFDETAGRFGDAVAVRASDGELCYSELAIRVERGASVLAERGSEGDRIAVLAGQSFHLVAAFLSVLKAGRVYVPLDGSLPASSLRGIVQKSEANLVVAEAGYEDLARRVAPEVHLIPTDALFEARNVDKERLPRISPDSSAYIFFTSGSTGRPKGVVDSHRSVLHNILRYTNTLRIAACDRLSLLQSASFSGSISSLLGALLNGAAVLPFDLRAAGVHELASWLCREQVTVYHSVPAIFRALAATAVDFSVLPLRVIRLEGDQATWSDARIFQARFPRGCVLVNGLGATECGLARQFLVEHGMSTGHGVLPIGYPVPGVEAAVVDPSGRPRRPGEIGEIVVRSRFLASGYWGRDDLTAAAFSEPDEEGMRTYRSGDLGRLQPDGCLEHIGRVDARAKLLGEWVECDAIEAALVEHEGVSEAVVCVVPGDVDGGQDRLVGYVVSCMTGWGNSADLRCHLEGRLPARMVPSVFVFLERLPLSRHGKVDRVALPPPPRTRPDLGTEYVPPRTSVEKELVWIWGEVLAIDRVGVRDGFVELGGQSLSASRVAARIFDELEVSLDIAAVLRARTIEGLAREIVVRTAQKPAIAHVERLLERIEEMEGADVQRNLAGGEFEV